MREKNDMILLEITALSHEGSGIGRCEDGTAVFVPNSAPGDQLQVRITKRLSRYCYGRIEQIVTPSPARVPPACPAFPRCGGCTLRHIHYDTQLQIKQKWLAENMRRIGGVTLDWEPIIPSPLAERYRNKAQFPVRLVNGEVRTGFFAPRSHRLIPVDDCLLQPAQFSQIARVVCDFLAEYQISPYDEITHRGLVRHLFLRQTADGGVLVCLVINGKKLPHWGALWEKLQATGLDIRTLVLNHNTQKTNVITGQKQSILAGAGNLTDTLCGVSLNISPTSFYQVNHAAAELLYAQALQYAAPKATDILLDLYCGTGSIGLSMAGHVGELIGVEIVEAAVEDARENARRAQIHNARFLCADAADAARQLSAQGLRPNIVVLDPPRRGADEATLKSIAAMAPDKLVYISCNSATLARDSKFLAELGYRATRGRAVDLFPQTVHTEAVVAFARSE
jgi:23S rRNA (uracil-5-)-methyltransferase RumA